jgi:simple sugar transport system permease protein
VGISKRFGPTVALRDAGIAVRAGETHGLVGRNGAGKSTLVAILTGLLRPDAGRVRVDRISFAVFVVGGVLAAVAGLTLVGRVGAIDANLGDGMIFTVFAAAVIGGISLDGGRGSLIGALAGVLLLSTVENLPTLSHVQPFWIQAIYGGIILAALVLSRVAGGRSQN